ncbi:DUF2231 domain-containing protein [Corynebacterium sp.]|uniref:DUF2231 domain-containing protein n=1 Tax=Corynebacterium sp. TaxID=1720 RepID=UPI002A91586A|nr:DUF2231 domain-containing protein [Corynebacterium sp.]MDY5786288.1 DUF2231 domain-containing protein [Corynebacterium sp.]
MFMSIAGIPAHPLVIHLAAVAAPLAAALAIAWALQPGRFTRSWRITALITSVVTAASMLAARSTGESLLAPMGLSESNLGEVAQHAAYANAATAAVVVLLGAVALFFIHSTGRFSIPAPGAIRGLMVVAAIATIISVVLVGHAGAQLAWADFPGN